MGICSGAPYVAAVEEKTIRSVPAARMAALLQAKGLGPDALSFSVQPDARHNEKAWRNEFPKAVAWLYR